MDAELQQKYMQLQTMDAQLKQLEQQLQQISMQLQELLLIKDSLIELPKSKDSPEILVPLGNGIFAKSNLKDKEEVVVNVGSNIAVKKKFPDALDMMTKQIEEFRNVEGEIMAEMQRLSLNAKVLEQELTAKMKK